ncbi:MAG: hypothetical protein GY756_05135 [bacterium]|nr:hypothetical protein [bacterium]
MSKLIKLSLLLSALFLIGCSSTPPQMSYVSKIKIKPAVKKDQYYMHLKVIKESYNEGEVVFIAPKMLIIKGVPVEILSGEIIKLKCNVLVTDKLGEAEAKAEVRIDNFQTFKTWNFTQTLLLNKRIDEEVTMQEMKQNAEIKKIEDKTIRKEIVKKESLKSKSKSKPKKTGR